MVLFLLSLWSIGTVMAQEGEQTPDPEINMNHYVDIELGHNPDPRAGNIVAYELRLFANKPGTKVCIQYSGMKEVITVNEVLNPDIYYFFKIQDGTKYTAYPLNNANRTVRIYGDITAIKLPMKTNGIYYDPKQPIFHSLNLKHNPLVESVSIQGVYNLETIPRPTVVDGLGLKKLCFEDHGHNIVIDVGPILDPINCPALEEMLVFPSTSPNDFSWPDFNHLACLLPDRTGYSDKGVLMIESEFPSAIFHQSTGFNYTNYKAKNWEIQYVNTDNDNQVYEPVPSSFGKSTSSCPSTTPTLNTDRRIVLDVKSGKQIKLMLVASQANTPVKIVSGSNTYTYDVSNSIWSAQTANCTASGNKMTVYGNVAVLSCANNGENITGIDISRNLGLKWLICPNNSISSLDLTRNSLLEQLNCSNNNLTRLDISRNYHLTYLALDKNPISTNALNEIYCALPDRQGKIYPLSTNTDSNYDKVIATNKSIATDKNWEVRYKDMNDFIPATTGSFTCGEEYENYIELSTSAQQGYTYHINLAGAEEDTPIKMVAGNSTTGYNVYQFRIGKNWTGKKAYYTVANSSLLKIYGKVAKIDCSESPANAPFKLWNLNVSHNPLLEEIKCANAELKSLDLSANTKLKILECENNQLQSLDVSANTELERIVCIKNPISQDELDKLYCSLPDRFGKSQGSLFVATDSSDPRYDLIQGTNAQNAIDNNWKVKANNGTTIPTTGVYDCSLSSSRYITLEVKPGEEITLGLIADNSTDPIKIISGDKVYNTTSSGGLQKFVSGATAMRVYGNISHFVCRSNGNNITGLDVSHNTELKILDCQNNQISSLDVSKNIALEKINCYGNPFTTVAMDKLYCSLPDREGKSQGKIFPVKTSDDTNHTDILATNKGNATANNWSVLYGQDYTEVPTTGSYVCGSVTDVKDVKDVIRKETLSIYPNPAQEQITVEVSDNAVGRQLTIVDVAGKVVYTQPITATTITVTVHRFQQGIYFVKADNVTSKLVIK